MGVKRKRKLKSTTPKILDSKLRGERAIERPFDGRSFSIVED